MKYLPQLFIVIAIILSSLTGIYKPEPGAINESFRSSIYRQQDKNISAELTGPQISRFDIKLQAPVASVLTHHIPAGIPILTEFYSGLKSVVNPTTFIIIGPDHVDAGKSGFTFSKSDFRTQYGTLRADMAILDKLEDSGLAVHDEKPFDDHSIQSQVILISKFFPRAKIVPIMVRSSTLNEEAQLLGKYLAENTGANVFLVASVDFSHYLSEKQAVAIDTVSAGILEKMDIDTVGLVEADSPQSLSAMMAFAKAKKSVKSQTLGVFNSAQFGYHDDYTTGYVIQVFGR